MSQAKVFALLLYSQRHVQEGLLTLVSSVRKQIHCFENQLGSRSSYFISGTPFPAVSYLLINFLIKLSLC